MSRSLWEATGKSSRLIAILFLFFTIAYKRYYLARLLIILQELQKTTNARTLKMVYIGKIITLFVAIVICGADLN